MEYAQVVTQKVTFQNVLRWTDEECRNYLEQMRWPNGAHCPKCGVNSPYRLTRKSTTKNLVKTLFKCRKCRKQFTATVGTIFEDSKVALSKWFAAIYLMCASKKGVSAHQIHRQLGVTYKSAWFMCHRIREAMKDKSFPLLTGIVEADETYIYPKRQRGHPVWRERQQDEFEMGLRKKGPRKAPYQHHPTVFGMMERGGKARTMVIKVADHKTVQPILVGIINSKDAQLFTDASSIYRNIKRHMTHKVVKHEETYVDDEVHIQGIENYWSILKRGIIGTFHHVGVDYLPSYLQEFDYRYNRRKTTDEERFASLLGQTQGRLHWYCRTPQPQNPHA